MLRDGIDTKLAGQGGSRCKSENHWGRGFFHFFFASVVFLWVMHVSGDTYVYVVNAAHLLVHEGKSGIPNFCCTGKMNAL